MSALSRFRESNTPIRREVRSPVVSTPLRQARLDDPATPSRNFSAPEITPIRGSVPGSPSPHAGPSRHIGSSPLRYRSSVFDIATPPSGQPVRRRWDDIDADNPGPVLQSQNGPASPRTVKRRKLHARSVCQEKSLEQGRLDDFAQASRLENMLVHLMTCLNPLVGHGLQVDYALWPNAEARKCFGEEPSTGQIAVSRFQGA